MNNIYIVGFHNSEIEDKHFDYVKISQVFETIDDAQECVRLAREAGATDKFKILQHFVIPSELDIFKIRKPSPVVKIIQDMVEADSDSIDPIPLD